MQLSWLSKCFLFRLNRHNLYMGINSYRLVAPKHVVCGNDLFLLCKLVTRRAAKETIEQWVIEVVAAVDF